MQGNDVNRLLVESLQGNDVDRLLVDKLVRVVSKREGLAGELNSARATLVGDLKREQDGLVAIAVV